MNATAACASQSSLGSLTRSHRHTAVQSVFPLGRALGTYGWDAAVGGGPRTEAFTPYYPSDAPSPAQSAPYGRTRYKHEDRPPLCPTKPQPRPSCCRHAPRKIPQKCRGTSSSTCTRSRWPKKMTSLQNTVSMHVFCGEVN